MAELALAVVGVAVAWKNILDFGQLMMDLLADDDWERKGLLYNLRTKDFLLRDWGNHYGVDRDNGDFHKFEPQRKEFLIKVIFRLHDSRMRAFKILKGKYLMAVEDGNDDEEEEYEGPDLSRKAKGFARLIDKAKTMSKKTRDKGRWLTHDQRTVKELIQDADEQYRHLKALTFESIPFMLSVMDSRNSSQPLQASLDLLETRAKQENEKEIDHLRRTRSFPIENEAVDWDRETAVSYATKNIVSCDQAERVRELVNQGYSMLVDTRIIHGVHDWWMDDKSGSLVLETPYDGGDDVSAVTCAAVYYLASCHKIIYVFDPTERKSPSLQLADMVSTITMTLISIAGEDVDADHSLLPPGNVDGSVSSKPGNLPEIIKAFENIVGRFIVRADQRFLIIVEGLDDLVDLTTDEPVRPAIRLFLQSLARVCNIKQDGRSVVKVLFGCRGAATAVSEYVGDTEVLNTMDRAARKENIMAGLAERW
ncbi:hypothetical protein LTR84_012246 [Exophiala bonariae]|uniref:Prion-inhibition and propagation HeLo domain-containing protein n=1 Tax=Exophiala bonariae TaxID=1690606 RepID=A0AAV9NG39_9EURO|nr:hypothetical protein LTR84_012246 [Exophiala bonariae]